MLSQTRDKNTIKDFYETPILEQGLKVRPQEIEEYLRKELEHLCGAIKKGAYVIDIGSGDGRVLRALNSIAGRRVGIDFSDFQAYEAKKRVPDAEIFLGDVKNTGFRDNSFDYAILAYNTFGNLGEGKLPALFEAKRIVKADGKIIISVYADSVLDAQLQFYQMLGLNVEKIDADAVYLKEGLVSERFSKEKLQNLIERAGLYGEIMQLTPISLIAEVRKH